jgi:hypothetical protein
MWAALGFPVWENRIYRKGVELQFRQLAERYR